MKLRTFLISRISSHVATSSLPIGRIAKPSLAQASLMIAISLALAANGLAQVVQLPSYRNFSTTGSAWVPDGGSASLGGSGYAAAGSASRGAGPGGTRAVGGIAGGASMSASAQIIDLDAMDEALLTGNRGTQASTGVAPATPATGPLAPRGAAAARVGGGESLAANRKQTEAVRVTPDHWARILSSNGAPAPAAHPALREVNVQHYLQMGRAAEQGGRLLAAGVYYRMAMEAMSPRLKQRYEEALVRQAAEAEANRVQNLQRAAAMQFQP